MKSDLFRTQTLSRRLWLQQSGILVAGLTFLGASSVPRQGSLQVNDVIRLGSNENPYGPSKYALEAMGKALGQSNRYAHDAITKLRDLIARANQVTRDHIILGAGSSELLGLASQLSVLKGNEILTANPTFKLWFRLAEKIGMKISYVQTTPDKLIDLTVLSEKISTNTSLIYLCNPNNPTGTTMNDANLRQFIKSVPKSIFVLIDEAYLEYAQIPTVVDMVSEHPNLIVARTFSKVYGLAGARVGYAVAHPDVIRQLNELQPWNNNSVSAVSAEAAIASLQDEAFVKTSIEKNANSRKVFCDVLSNLKIPYIKSETNFIYCSFEDTSRDVIKEFADNKVRIGSQFESAGKWTRISIGTVDEMKIAGDILKKIING